MPISSVYGNIDIPSCNLLTHLFSAPDALTDQPVWIDCENPSNSLSTRQAAQWAKRIGCGLQKHGLKKGDVVLLCTTNHIFVPVAFFGIVGSTCVFSGANPSFTPAGK
jgi:acyl-CoA synthetase (AMP-forming)/AMP-acid ligase II